MYNRVPQIIKSLYSDFIFDIPTAEPLVYLTFDDGPHPTITPWILEILEQYGFKATFFCVGENARRYPDILKLIMDSGHSIGNHTFNHLNGWKTDLNTYSQNISEAAHYLSTDMFRPPYGKMTKEQRKATARMGYKIYMWDVLSRDFDQRLTWQKCLKICTDYTARGSIVVFHDSAKAEKNMRPALEGYLEWLSAYGISAVKL